MLCNIQRKPHIKKNFGSLSRGQKGQNPPHSSDLEKNQNFQNFIFAFFCELNHSEQENQKKNFGKFFSLLTLNIPDTQKKNQNFQKKNFDFNFDDFDFDKFQCSLYTLLFPSSSLVCLIVMDLENVGTKFIYFWISILMILILTNFNFQKCGGPLMCACY